MLASEIGINLGTPKKTIILDELNGERVREICRRGDNGGGMEIEDPIVDDEKEEDVEGKDAMANSESYY